MPEADSPEDGANPRDRLEAVDRAVKDALDQRAAAQREADARELQARQTRAGGAAWRTLSQLVLATTLMALVGYGADIALGSSPWGLLAGLFIGFGAGMWMATQSAVQSQAQTDQQAGGDHAPAQEEGRDGDLR